MKLLVFSLIFLTVASLIPNCAYETNNRCLSCYFGFELVSGRCDRCSTGFVMMNEICINQEIVQQQQMLQQQLTSTSSLNTSRSNTSSLQQNIIPISTVSSVSTSAAQSQSSLSSSQSSSTSVQTVSLPAGNIASVSSVPASQPTFDVNNTGVMYLLQLFGLAGNIPSNCVIFTPDFKCIRCGTGFILGTNGICSIQTQTINTGNVAISGSTSTSQSSISTNTSNLSSTSNIFGSLATHTQTLINNDPNCQTPNPDGSCAQCYFRYFYSPDVRRCLVVNPLCGTWDRLGNCLSCYPGYRLSGSNCTIDIQTPGNSDITLINQSGQQLQQQSSQSTQSGQTSSSQTSSGSSTTAVSGGALLINADQNCRFRGPNGICSECFFSFYLNSMNGMCTPVNRQCLSWNQMGHCLSCYQGYVLSGTLCVIGSNASSNSSTSSTGVSGGVIVTTTVSSDPNCRSQNADGSCSQCYQSFYYDSVSAKRCVSVNPLCRTWNNFGHCLSCYQGYILFSNTCIIEPVFQPSVNVGVNDLPLTNQDPNCNTYKDQVCIKCATRTYLDPVSKRCLQIDANCRLWTENGICTNCYNGYFIFNQRQCRLMYPEVSAVQLKSPLNTDTNCRASDSNGVCTQCIWRFVLNQTTRRCMKVNDLCRTWSDSTALCTGCYGGYSLTTSGECRISW